ncbi:MAG: hypothetical protein H0V82_01720 [Candidatus Protochlamydia sp.]|nr:hypothetical protein [Candidatus Protochlamydia sp.]
MGNIGKNGLNFYSWVTEIYSLSKFIMIDIVNFKGVKIKMMKDNIKTPFVHASFGSYDATFSIRTGNRINGQMPTS